MFKKIILPTVLSVLTLLLFQCEWDNPKGKGPGGRSLPFDSTRANTQFTPLAPAAQWDYLEQVVQKNYKNPEEAGEWVSKQISDLIARSEEDNAFSKAKMLADSTRSDLLRCKIRYQLGKICIGRGENDEAAGFYRASLALAQHLNEADLQVLSLIGIAAVHYNLLQYDSAIINLEKGKRIAALHKLDNRMPDLYGNIANSKNLKGENLEAIKMFVKAANLYKASGDSNKLAIIYNNIGIVFLDMKRYKKAIEYFNLASAINKKNNITSQLITNYGNLGLAYKNQDSIGRAKAYYLKSKALSEATQDEFELSRNLYNLGNLVIMEENYDAAAMYFDSAEFYCKKNNIDYGLMLLEMARSELYQREGKPQIAITTGLNALKKVEPYDMPYEKASLYKVLYNAYKAIGDVGKALYYFEKNTAISEELANSESLKIVWDFENQYEKEKSARQISELEKDVIRQQSQKKMVTIVLAAVFLLLLAAVFLFVQTKRATAIQAELEQQRFNNLKETMAAKGREATGKALLVANMNEQLDWIRKKITEMIPHMNNPAQELLQDLVRMIEKNRSAKAWEDFEENLAQINSELYKKLLAIDPRLTPTELQICGLIAQNQNTKDIATLTNRSKQTIDNIRHSLRKKLNLGPEDNLAAFIRAL